MSTPTKSDRAAAERIYELLSIQSPNRDGLILGMATSIAEEMRAEREAVAKLVAKIKEIHDHPAYYSVFAEASNRGRPYSGPNYENELAAVIATQAAGQEAKP